MEPEVFAAICAVQSPVTPVLGGSWSTGQDTGSDPDD
jgi:hypothetical protein